MTKVAVAGVVAAFVLFYIMTSPDQAVTIVHGSWKFITHLAHGVGSFVDKLAA